MFNDIISWKRVESCNNHSNHHLPHQFFMVSYSGYLDIKIRTKLD